MNSRHVAEKRRELVIIAHNIRSLHNLGSLFRTADAAGVSKIYCTGYTGNPLDNKTAKVSLGAEKTVAWERARTVALLIQKLKRAGFTIAALEQHPRSKPLQSYHSRFPLALIVGNEVRGISPALLKRADVILEIPMRGKKESLNVSVAFGIAVYELLKAHKVHQVHKVYKVA